MGDVNKLSAATKLETSNKNEYDSAAMTTKDKAIHAGNNLRVIAIRDSTFNDLKELALTYKSHPTFDTVIRKLFEAYKNNE
jgi:hypothetical protein